MFQGHIDQDTATLVQASAIPDMLFERGLYWASGRSGVVNLVAAHKWFNLAALKGRTDAIQLRREVAELMSEVEIAMAQREARAWITAHTRDLVDYRVGHVQLGGVSSLTRVSPSCFSRTICRQSASASSAETSAEACETTTTCDSLDAWAIKRASGGNNSGCRLVSGSLRTIRAGGRGESSAATSRR